MQSIKKVNALCRSVLKLTDDDLQDIEDMAKDQKGYVHPLKHGKQSKINGLGNHNQKVLEALTKLRQVLIDGAIACK